MKVIMGASERIVVLDHGRKIAQRCHEKIRAAETVVSAYMGRR